MPKIRVLLAGEDRTVRDGLRALLAGHRDIDVVGQAADAIEAIRKTRELQVHVVAMDTGPQPIGALRTVQRILAEWPACRVLIMSRYEDRDAVLKAMEAGASGFLCTGDGDMDLAEAIRAVAHGGMVLHPSAARIVVEAYLGCQPCPPQDEYERLTEREREILILVAEGYTNQQIAELLTISPKTVDSHRTNLMAKLDLHSGREVVKYALRLHLIDL